MPCEERFEATEKRKGKYFLEKKDKGFAEPDYEYNPELQENKWKIKKFHRN